MSQRTPRQRTKVERRRKIQAQSAQVSRSENLPTDPTASELGDDLLVGAAAIARFLFGTEKERRRVYYLAGTGELPCFQLGQTVCARRSALLRHIEHRERVTLETTAEVNVA
jgi:hypothetical protein